MNEINAAEILKPFREEIDRLDQELIKVLGQRFQVVHQVGETKAKYGLSPVQPARMDEVLHHVALLAQENGLDPAFVQNLYRMMIDHAHTLEFAVAEGEQNA